MIDVHDDGTVVRIAEFGAFVEILPGAGEVRNRSFISDDLARKWCLDRAIRLSLANPIAEAQSLMRLSLLPRTGQGNSSVS